MCVCMGGAVYDIAHVPWYGHHGGVYTLSGVR